jgi:hypothetical protein
MSFACKLWSANTNRSGSIHYTHHGGLYHFHGVSSRSNPFVISRVHFYGFVLENLGFDDV